MKSKMILSFLFLSTLQFSCNSQSADPLDLREVMVKKLIDTAEPKAKKINGKIIVVTTKYCENNDCGMYFRDFQNQVQLFTMEEAFQRAIRNYIEIESFDEKSGKIILRHRMGDQFDIIEIN